MCSVLAFSGEFKSEVVSRLLEWSRVRGLHAFGFSYVCGGEIKTMKFLDFNQFKNSLLELAPDKFIAHFRYSTSGDWKSLENNQPILSKEAHLVFNGVIDMGTKSEMEKKWNCQLQTENDGELAMIKWKSGELENMIKNKFRSFAGIILTEENEIIAIRNERRPLWVGDLDGSKYLASTSDILKRSGILDINELKEYEQHKY
jgi:glutamine phosphoribosylpyrophosphate amidotransferase